MKKFISIALLLAMCLALFAGCVSDAPAQTDAPKTPLASAKDYLFAMYRGTEGVVRRDFERVSIVMIDGVKFTVAWTCDDTDNVTVTAGETTTTVDINERPTEAVNFKLTATISDAEGNSESVSFSHSIEAVEVSGPAAPTFVDAPVAGTAYKFGLQQASLGQTLYFTGEMSGYYLATSEDAANGVDVTLEAVEGGFAISFNQAGAKKYIDIVPREDNPAKVNAVIADAPTAVYVWDSERKTMTAKVGETTWYLGTYSTYNTISPSDVSYIEDVSKIGDSQFPAGFVTGTAGGSTGGSEVTDGQNVVLYYGTDGQYITGTDYLYESSSGSTKHELVLSENQADAVVLTVKVSGDQVTFATADGKFLMADGTNVQLVDAEDDNTKFVLEPTAAGYFIKCANAEYNGKAQYLEVYSGYLTCYGMNDSKAEIYTFELKNA